MIISFSVFFVPYVIFMIEKHLSGVWGLFAFSMYWTSFNVMALKIDNCVLCVRFIMGRIQKKFFLTTVGINFSILILMFTSIFTWAKIFGILPQ